MAFSQARAHHGSMPYAMPAMMPISDHSPGMSSDTFRQSPSSNTPTYFQQTPPSNNSHQQDQQSLEASQLQQQQQRSVVRAACLNCRSAKRRCDGVAPVCGPCSSRGIEEGGCNFVSSKRGGPRYKGIKGAADAAKVKAEKDRVRGTAKLPRTKSRSQAGEYSGSQLLQHRASDATSTNSQRSDSPLHSLLNNNNGHSTQEAGSSKQSPDGTSLPSRSTDGSPFQLQNSAKVSAKPALQQAPQMQQAPPGMYSSVQDHTLQQMASANQSFDLGQPPAHASGPDDALNAGGPLSFANLELWQRLQDCADNPEMAAFTDFYSRLEMLPKAGVPSGNGSGPGLDPLDVLMDWEGGVVGNNVQDNEQGVRALLSDYYDLVYPSCPVLLSPGNLPSLAFYFSGKGPCGLFAAISAVVSLHLPTREAVKTLKNSQVAMSRLGHSPNNLSSGSGLTAEEEVMSTEEIAAYHAQTSEYILHQYAETKATCFIDASCPNPFAGMDEELITVEAAAAHTLLCHYYYGSGKPLSHHRAYKHAVEAWNLVQKLDLLSKVEMQELASFSSMHPNAARPFSAELKLEWAKRVYWASYAAATVMSCTGGFQPFGNPRDEILDLKLRPHLEVDIAAWGVMVRGAQQVSRTYRLLYDLDHLRARLAARGSQMNVEELHQVAMERQTLFNAMLKLDAEIGTYTRFDLSWRISSTPQQGHQGVGYIDNGEIELAKNLKIAGRLMTSGAIIILHRAQAFSNARVFMEPQCGIPEAVRVQKANRFDVILHRASEADGGEVITTAPPVSSCNALGVTDDRMGAAEMTSSFANMTGASTHRTTNRRGDNDLPSSSSAVSSDHQAAGPPHPFLTDRFAGGPFEPSHSLERCRFAASTMIGVLPLLLPQSEAPKLPPYSACSFVLGAYATLMLTLLIQIRSEDGSQVLQLSGGHTGTANGIVIRNDRNNINNQQEKLRKQLALHRAPVQDIINVLDKFSKVWDKAREYRQEVATLLAANETIV